MLLLGAMFRFRFESRTPGLRKSDGLSSSKRRVRISRTSPGVAPDRMVLTINCTVGPSLSRMSPMRSSTNDRKWSSWSWILLAEALRRLSAASSKIRKTHEASIDSLYRVSKTSDQGTTFTALPIFPYFSLSIPFVSPNLYFNQSDLLFFFLLR